MSFDAMVEVGGALGPSFEAQAVNLSEEGMSLRTAYLPEVGQPVMCRFDAGAGLTVVAAGEVLWNSPLDDGGEFGIRFMNLDAQSTVALQRILGMGSDGQVNSMEVGRKVRLHIEGLASPMRARVRDQRSSGITAYSELGFLQMGKPLDLEDAASGSRRPALIDRVEVAVEEASRIPQLVVSLRYDDEEGRAAALGGEDVAMDEDARDTPHDGMGPDAASAASLGTEARLASAADGERGLDAEDGEPGNKLKSAIARNAAKVSPALKSIANRTKIAAAVLAARVRRREGGDDVEIPIRRTTAPAPGGGLHAEGRKVVRASVPDDRLSPLDEPPPTRRLGMTKKKAAVGAAACLTVALVFFAVRKPAPAPQLASTPPAETAPGAPPPADPSAALAEAAPRPVAPPTDPLAQAAQAMATTKPGKPTPFTNGPIGTHPTVIKIKMDGPIDGIQGAPQPTGFTVNIPNRKSVEPTASLGEKDPRISAIRVASEAGGSEFSVAFKDGVPNYLVRAHGDVLEMVLAKPNSHGDKAEAKMKKRAGKKH